MTAAPTILLPSWKAWLRWTVACDCFVSHTAVWRRHGTFIAFVDADDYLHPQYVELLLRALEEHPDADLAVTPSVRTNQSADASLGVNIRHAETVTGDGRMIRKALFAGGGGMSHNQWHTCHGKLFRRELLEDLSFPSGYTVYEDALFMNSVYARVHRYVMLRERIYFWVLHQQSALAMGSRSQGTNAYLECLRTIDREDSELRAVCLSRIIMHDVWLKYLGEERHSLPRAVWSEYIMSPSVSLFDKWKMLRLELCPKYRREFVESPRETEQHARPGVGKAPEDANGLVSVIVPVCNVEAWLPSCLDSIINQSYSNLEIILVDDGSTDTSGYICEIYAARDSRIKVVHQKNQGLSGARNSGLAIATGVYVIMPDADDTLHPRLIEIAHRALQRGDFPFAMVWKQDTRHVISCDAMPEIEHGIQLRLLTQQELIGGLTNRTEMDVNCHVVWNKLYRRSAIGHLRFEDTASQDTVFNARLYLRIPYAIVVDAPLYYWLQRRGSLSRNPAARETPPPSLRGSPRSWWCG